MSQIICSSLSLIPLLSPHPPPQHTDKYPCQTSRAWSVQRLNNMTLGPQDLDSIQLMNLSHWKHRMAMTVCGKQR